MATHFFKTLTDLVGKKLEVTINDNRSTMLSVKWEPHQTKLSIHRIFLSAPMMIYQALASYLRREERRISPFIKAFIKEHAPCLDYSHRTRQQALTTQGSVYDLQAIMDKINSHYFKGEMQLAITWFGKAQGKKNRTRYTFGLYYDRLKLVKIHRLLDSSLVPPCVIEYIVYHEMLHAACPGVIDKRGFHRVHHKEFKLREQLFSHYSQAREWIKLFVQRTVNYGRSQQMGKYQTSQKSCRRPKRKSLYTSL